MTGLAQVQPRALCQLVSSHREGISTGLGHVGLILLCIGCAWAKYTPSMTNATQVFFETLIRACFPVLWNLCDVIPEVLELVKTLITSLSAFTLLLSFSWLACLNQFAGQTFGHFHSILIKVKNVLVQLEPFLYTSINCLTGDRSVAILTLNMFVTHRSSQFVWSVYNWTS